MKKILFAIFFCGFSVIVFSQKDLKQQGKAIKSTPILENKKVIKTENKTAPITYKKSVISKEDQLKFSTKKFYLINDKPVSRETYMDYLMRKKKEKTPPIK